MRKCAPCRHRASSAFHRARRRDARPLQSPRQSSTTRASARSGLSRARQISKSEPLRLPLGTSRRDTRSTLTYVTGCEEQWRTIVPRAFSTREDTVDFSRVISDISNLADRRSPGIYGAFGEFYRNVANVKERNYYIAARYIFGTLERPDRIFRLTGAQSLRRFSNLTIAARKVASFFERGVWYWWIFYNDIK